VNKQPNSRHPPRCPISVPTCPSFYRDCVCVFARFYILILNDNLLTQIHTNLFSFLIEGLFRITPRTPYQRRTEGRISTTPTQGAKMPCIRRTRGLRHLYLLTSVLLLLLLLFSSRLRHIRRRHSNGHHGPHTHIHPHPTPPHHPPFAPFPPQLSPSVGPTPPSTDRHRARQRPIDRTVDITSLVRHRPRAPARPVVPIVLQGHGQGQGQMQGQGQGGNDKEWQSARREGVRTRGVT
jgi:hypothetical protein